MRATLKLRPVHWVAIDLMALLIIVGWAVATCALDAGVWRPMGPVTPTYWPLLAFPVALAVVSGFAVLLAWQLQSLGVIGRDEVRPALRPRELASVASEAAPVPVALSGRPTADLPSPCEELAQDAPETERVMVACGV